MKNAQKMLSKIKSRKIEPIPKWKFLLKNNFLWGLFLFSILFGSFAFSVVLFSIQNTEFDLISHISESKIQFFIKLLPIAWILFLGIFLFSAYKLFENTKKGYKFSSLFITGGSFILSLIFGSFLFFAGGGEKLEHLFAEKIPLYESLEEKKISLWSMPHKGFLSGIIIQNNKKIILQDWSHKNWKIDKNKALIRPKVKILMGEKIKIIGKISDNNIFIAEEIRPWKGKGKRRSQGRLNSDK